MDADLRLTRLLSSINALAGQPMTNAVCLPAEAYTSAGLLEVERDKIFRKEWICLGRADEIPETGDFFTSHIDTVPLIVLRRDKGTIAALVNVCRHHYAQVVSGEGNARRFCCPYHGWTYDLTGKLVAAPRMPAVNQDQRTLCGLREIRTELWGGFIYGSLAPDTPPLAPRLQGLSKLIGNYHIDRMRTVWHKRQVWATNWKVLTENFLEAYHIPVTHRETLLPFAPVEGIHMLPGGDGYCFYEHRMSERSEPLDPAIAIPNADLSDHEYQHAYIGGIYPTHVFSVAWDWIFWLSLQPEGTDHVHVDWGIGGLVKLPKNESHYPGFPYPELVEKVNEEDRIRVESVQKGAESGFATQGPLNHHEETIWHWLKYLNQKLTS